MLSFGEAEVSYWPKSKYRLDQPMDALTGTVACSA